MQTSEPDDLKEWSNTLSSERSFSCIEVSNKRAKLDEPSFGEYKEYNLDLEDVNCGGRNEGHFGKLASHENLNTTLEPISDKSFVDNFLQVRQDAGYSPKSSCVSKLSGGDEGDTTLRVNREYDHTYYDTGNQKRQ